MRDMLYIRSSLRKVTLPSFLISVPSFQYPQVGREEMVASVPLAKESILLKPEEVKLRIFLVILLQYDVEVRQFAYLIACWRFYKTTFDPSL